MHDPEKSDSGIVAAKPTNKAGRPAAEPAEPRPGTKGNADQQSTHRTQSRVRVTQALELSCERFAAFSRSTDAAESLAR
jgi:RNA-directed DNA polymerase